MVTPAASTPDQVELTGHRIGCAGRS